MLSYFQLSRVLLSFLEIPWSGQSRQPPAPQLRIVGVSCMSISKFNLCSMISRVPGAKRVAKSVEGPFAERSDVYIYVAWNSALAAWRFWSRVRQSRPGCNRGRFKLFTALCRIYRGQTQLSSREPGPVRNIVSRGRGQSNY